MITKLGGYSSDHQDGGGGEGVFKGETPKLLWRGGGSKRYWWGGGQGKKTLMGWRDTIDTRGGGKKILLGLEGGGGGWVSDRGSDTRGWGGGWGVKRCWW